ncbi:MAG: ankyrin repeat-containing protein [Acidobacteria bacterium]|nr:ankyrin repeat-containing protein [Acidobacteriota bacterium]
MIQLALVVFLAVVPGTARFQRANVAHPGGLENFLHDARVQNKDQKKNQKGLSDDEVTFIEAARQGDTETVKRFLDAGMSVNLLDKRDDELSTVLMVAAMAGKTETAKLLIARGADINAKTKLGRTALTWASWRGMTDTVKALLTSGAEVNARDVRGGTPLNFAVDKGRIQTVTVLLDAGANPNFHHAETGQTALIDAVVHHHVEIVRILLARGARVNDQDKSGRKPVDWARRLNFVDIEVMLRAAAAKAP